MEQEPMTGARANLSEIAARARLLRVSIRLIRRGTPQAAVVPLELADAAEAVGGPDKATELLLSYAGEGASDAV